MAYQVLSLNQDLFECNKKISCHGEVLGIIIKLGQINKKSFNLILYLT